jgi:hypothetical protein
MTRTVAMKIHGVTAGAQQSRSRGQPLCKTTNLVSSSRTPNTGTLQRGMYPLMHAHGTTSATSTAARKVERERIKDIITDVEFENKLIKSVHILAPIDQLIVKYESDSVALSEVHPDLHLLPMRFSSEPARQFISDNELQYLTELSSNRFNFMYSEAHGLAYLLDPR